MGYLLSIVVPTKDRYFYLKHLISLIHSFNSNEIELVVQDNTADNTEILEFIENEKFNHLKYFHSTENLSVGQNSDKAILNSTGEYVCFIGDDDLVTANIIPCVRWMERNDIKCVFPKRIMYFWPDYCDTGDERAALHHDSFSGKVSFVDTAEALGEVLKIGCICPGRLPMIYHGIVSRDVLDKIWEKCGTLFPGASPDIASGVCLSMVVDKYATFCFPVVIAGNSRTGGGGQRIIKHHAVEDFGKLPFLPKNIEETWYHKVPRIWSNATIWSESAIEALICCGREDLVEKVDFEALYEYFAVNYFYYRKYSFALTNSKIRLFIKLILGLVVLYSKKIVKIIFEILHIRIRNSKMKVFGIEDSKQLCDYFTQEKLFFDNFIK